MEHCRKSYLAPASLLVLIICPTSTAANEPVNTKKVVLIAGEIDQGHPKGTHEYQKTVLRFAEDLKPLTGLLDFKIEVHFDGWPANPTTLEDADTIVLVSNGSDRKLSDHPFLVDDRLEVIERQMDRGCGLVLVHWSTFWPKKHRDKILRWVGGYFDYETGPRPRGWYSKIKTESCLLGVWRLGHPIVRGVWTMQLPREELYYNLRFSKDPNATLTPVLRWESIRDEGGGIPDEFPVIAWAFERSNDSAKNKGRGFAFTGGHFFENWENESQRRMLGNAILWTAGIDPPPRGIQFGSKHKPHDVSIDVLDAEKINVALVTGHQHPAHDWRTTSQVILDGLAKDRRIAASLIADPEFFADPRLQDYDAIVFNYCNWKRAGMSDAAKKGFVKFLQRGGGLVLIHFANGAFHFSLPETPDSDWPEYRNICRRVWDHTGGISGHDVFGEFEVQVTDTEHPITAGIQPFITRDELYYRQQGDAPVNVLATARSEVTEQDEPMAFVYQYGRGRIFQTVLGHSGESLRIPQVSQMLRRAVAWVAKRSVKDPTPAEHFDPEYLSKWTPKRRRDVRFPYEDENDDDWMDDRFAYMDKGPFYSSSIDVPGQGMVPKAIAVRLGKDQKSTVMFDTQSLNWRVGWTKDYLNFPPNRFGILAMPTIAGEIMLRTTRENRWRQSRDKSAGTAIEDAHYTGLYLVGHRVVFSYRIGDVDILDSISDAKVPYLNERVFRRDLNFNRNDTSLELPIIETNGTEFEIDKELYHHGWGDGTLGHGFPATTVAVSRSGSQATMVAVQDGELIIRNDFLSVRNIEPDKKANRRDYNGLSLYVWQGPASKLESVVNLISVRHVWDLRLMVDPEYAAAKPAYYRNLFGDSRQPPTTPIETSVDMFPFRWGEPLKTTGRKSTNDRGLVVETITIPYKNPFDALMFTSGVDFFDDGRAAVCTIHGDVWLVDGIDDDLDKITWQRFATGLYQPLGLKIVEDHVHVLGRDQITRLHDLDDDGEADFYENFDDQLQITGQPHGYAMSLETDPQGRFYYIKSGGSSPHGGTMLRMTPASATKKTKNQLDVVATGYRHANGLGVSPTGIVTSADNEGNWVPSTRIDIVRHGGFYGHMPTHRREAAPKTYDGPLCWVPRELDNSAGGQVWIPPDRWGPLGGKMLHLSFGRCTVNLVLQQQVDGVDQAGVMHLDLPQFLSGSMRGRFNPNDGHLYVVGSDGWQTAAVRDGCFQRVRATGKPIYMPTDLRIRRNGIEITFSQPLDKEIATRREAWKIEQWNYRWTQQYGSEHYKVSSPDSYGHDPVSVHSARISEDGKTIFLATDELQPVMQMNILADLRAIDGSPMPCNIFNTINAVAD